MYSKDELLSKNIVELEEIAQQLDAKIKSGESQEEIIYSILDKQAEVEGNKNPLGTKRRRTRIAKKDTDRVYSVNGKDGENFDLKKNKVSNDTPSLFNDEPAPEPAPAKRGRPRKVKVEQPAEKEPAPVVEKEESNAVTEAPAPEAVMPVPEEPKDEIQPETGQKETADVGVEEHPEAEQSPIPEENYVSGESGKDSETGSSDLMAQLQAKISAHNENADINSESVNGGVWAGDPGDGTDFIV